MIVGFQIGTAGGAVKEVRKVGESEEGKGVHKWMKQDPKSWEEVSEEFIILWKSDTGEKQVSR